MNQQVESCDENESNATWETVAWCDSDYFVLDDNDETIPEWKEGKFINDDGCMM